MCSIEIKSQVAGSWLWLAVCPLRESGRGVTAAAVGTAVTSHSTKSRVEIPESRYEWRTSSGSLAHALRSSPLLSFLSSFQLLSSRLLQTIFIARSSSDAGKLLAHRSHTAAKRKKSCLFAAKTTLSRYFSYYFISFGIGTLGSTKTSSVVVPVLRRDHNTYWLDSRHTQI